MSEQLVHEKEVPKFEAPAPAEAVRPTTSNIRTDRRLGREALASLRLVESVPSIDWGAAKELAKPAAEHKLGMLLGEYKTFVPAFASALSGRRKGEPEGILVEVGQVREYVRERHPIVGFISDAVRAVWPWLADKIDGFFVRFARKKVQEKAGYVDGILQRISKVGDVKGQFVDEVETIYRLLVDRDLSYVDEDKRINFGGYRNRLFDVLKDIHSDGRWDIGLRRRMEKTPLTGLAGSFMRDPYEQGKLKLRAVTPEIVSGLESFLRSHGREDAVVSEHNAGDTLTHRAASRFAGKQLEQVASRVSATLETVYRALPASGQDFVNDVYGLCDQITKLASGGHSAQDIVDNIFKDILKLKKR
jgi:hypothetical protein